MAAAARCRRRAAPTFPADAVEVGRVLGAWGIKGWIKVQPYRADPQALFSSQALVLQPPERRPAPAAPAAGRCCASPQAREQGDGVVADAA